MEKKLNKTLRKIPRKKFFNQLGMCWYLSMFVEPSFQNNVTHACLSIHPPDYLD